MKTKSISKINRATHITKGNAIDDLGFTPDEAASIKLKLELHSEIMRIIEKRKLNSKQLEKILRVPQPRVSELLNGKIFEKTSSDRLAKYLHRLGKRVKVQFSAIRLEGTKAA